MHVIPITESLCTYRCAVFYTHILYICVIFQVGYAVTTYDQYDTKLPVIGFDMGGTSTDVSRFDGNYDHVFESTTAGVCIQAPQVLLRTCT